MYEKWIHKILQWKRKWSNRCALERIWTLYATRVKLFYWNEFFILLWLCCRTLASLKFLPFFLFFVHNNDNLIFSHFEWLFSFGTFNFNQKKYILLRLQAIHLNAFNIYHFICLIIIFCLLVKRLQNDHIRLIHLQLWSYEH